MNNHELFCSIKQQYLLSSEVAVMILNPLMEIYYAGIPAAQISYGEIGWVCFISVETVPKVGTNDQIFSTKPSGRSFCQLI